MPVTAEEERLAAAREGKAPWRLWGPYLSERQWGTVREDYSAGGTAWECLPHDHARSRAYRWGEDGIAGLCDDQQYLCFAVALWNGADPILKERMFGLTGNEGNHGEDVKEYYFYLDNVPSHAYMKYLYKYPQRAYPYADLVAENRRRTRADPEYELLDTGIFDDDRYFDVLVEYAKADATDILVLKAEHRVLSAYSLHCEPPKEALFTENESNAMRLWNTPNPSPYVKDAFHEYVIGGRAETVNPARVGSKAAAHYVFSVDAGETVVVRLRLRAGDAMAAPFGPEFDAVFERRKQEADAFYRRITPFDIPADLRNVQRQAFAGMLWSKQYYRYLVEHWLTGDPAEPTPPPSRWNGRNHNWWHLAAADVLSLPDKWEYPWFAAWDLAFHTIPFAMIDPDFAKSQLILLTRPWYMHPNGQIPAYEWAFSDVNPPVHAWAAIRVYQIEEKFYGRTDREFLERVFQKLLLNFTWWVNRKDTAGNNIFEGGFLGLDNISVFDRTSGLPSGGYLEQADGTSWMAMYCLNLLALALELAKKDPVYEDLATKFFEHFVYIGSAINHRTPRSVGLWNEEDGFYYDVLRLPDGRTSPVRAKTISGLIPIFAVTVAEREDIERFGNFAKRVRWFAKYQPELLQGLGHIMQRGAQDRVRLAIVDTDKLSRILAPVLDSEAMLSDYGVRSVSRSYRDHPCVFTVDGNQFTLDYEPAESRTALFGGNSNWRGPVWFPLNYLLIEALQKHDAVLGETFKIEFPTGSGHETTLWGVSTELTHRLITLFTRNADGRRPVNGCREKFQSDPYWRDLIPFHEYFHGDTGEGLGASHQTGWTGVVAKLIHQYAEYAIREHPELGREFALGAWDQRK